MADQRTSSINEGRDVLWKDTGAGRALAVASVTGQAASEAHIGQVGGEAALAEATPTLTVHAGYAANDYVGTSGTPITFANCARVDGGSGWIMSSMLIDKALQSVAGELWLFDETVTPPDDSAAWTLADADMAHCIGVITYSTYYASAANSVAMGHLSEGPIQFKCAAGSRDLYGCFVTRGAPTYADGDLVHRLWMLPN